jgi:prepilin-type N-terminal cleavage/methylation domain-containing protein
MSSRRTRDCRAAHGFTLIEVLVVVLVIGLLAAIAIPSLLSQKGKAVAAAAKEIARTGYEAAETYSTDHGGSYAGIAPSVLREYEPVLQLSAGAGNNAYLSNAESTESGKGFKVTAKAPNGDTFSYIKTQGNGAERTCEVAGGNPVTGCPNGSW